MKTLISLVVAAAFGVTLSGCNTISGAGKDVARSGEAIQDASLKVRADWREWRASHERDYDGARSRCTTGTDAERDACRDRVRAEYRARADEAAAKYRRSEFNSQTEQERREDAYDRARYSCYTLRGADEDRCIADARAKFRG